jgi:hypothetical protein
MKKIPLEILFQLDEKIINLSNNGAARRMLIQETANIYNLAESTVYRQLKGLSIHPDVRKPRKDKGCIRILSQVEFYYYCQIIAALKIASCNKQSHMISTSACIKRLESGEVTIKGKQINVQKNVLKLSTINKYLIQYYIAPKDIFAEPMVNHFQAKFANQCWQFDITPSELHRLPEQHPDDPRRIMLFSVVDDNSGITYSKYYYAAGEDTLTALDFLYHAFAKITTYNNELYGIPDFLYTDNGSFIKSRLFIRVMEKMGVKILSHLPKGKGGRKTTARSKGKSERNHRSIKSGLEPIYKLALPQTLDEMNELLAKFTQEQNNRRHRSLNLSRAQAWKINLSSDIDLTMCAYDHYQTLLREPSDRKAKSDATVQINNIHYQLSPEFAGEDIIVLLGLNCNEIHIEHRDQEYGPFLPVAPADAFGEYNHHEKSQKEEAADNVVTLSKHVGLNLPKIDSAICDTAQNIGHRFTSPLKTYETQLEARLAVARYLGKPLAKLSPDHKDFIKRVVERTLVNNEIIDAIDDYFQLKLISNKDTL